MLTLLGPSTALAAAARAGFSISGHSAGGSIASTHFMAFSDRVYGLVHIQAAPYGCAALTRKGEQRSFDLRCLPADVPNMTAKARASAAAGEIASLDNVHGKPVFVYAGGNDTVVFPAVGEGAAALYRGFGANVTWHEQAHAEHAFCTDGWPSCPVCNPCGVLWAPFINDCGFDLAGRALAHIYGALRPRVAPEPHGIWQIDQAAFFPPNTTEQQAGMHSRAYVYVPRPCEDSSAVQPARQTACPLHIVYHGCSSGVNSSLEGPDGLDIVKYAGYNAWAESNGLLVLYPQAYTSWCWNWDGHIIDDPGGFDTRAALQLNVVNAMAAAVQEGRVRKLG